MDNMLSLGDLVAGTASLALLLALFLSFFVFAMCELRSDRRAHPHIMLTVHWANCHGNE